MTATTEIKKLVRLAMASARKLAARARANKREAVTISREAAKLESSFERIVVMIGGTTSVTLRRVRTAVPAGVVRKGDFSGHRRRPNRHKRSLTAQACEAARIHGHRDGNWRVIDAR